MTRSSTAVLFQLFDRIWHLRLWTARSIRCEASLPQPSCRVVDGDGGLQFTLPELATAVELGLPLPILLCNNQGYGEIKTYMSERQIPQIGVDIYTPDFQAITKGFGAHAVKVHSMEALIEALTIAFAANAPTIIEMADSEAREW